jgi:hypothetical protein
MSNEAPAEAATRYSTEPRGRWRKVITGLPLLFVMILILAMILRPRESFVDSQTPGIYWLYFSFDKIWKLLADALILSCAFGLALIGCRKILWQSFDRLDRAAMLMHIVLFVSGLTLVLFGPTSYTNHLDAVNTGNHTYYLASSRDFEGPYWLPYYLIFECDCVGIMCRQIYASEEQHNRMVLTGSLEFDRAAGELQLVDNGKVIYTYQVSP